MGHKSKSKCQIRLEARSRATCGSTGRATDPQHRAAELQSRIARATEIRAMRTRQLATRARARVQHAQDVARGMRVKRHEETRRFRQSSVSKVDDAARRRNMQLLQLQLQCKHRTALILAKVEGMRNDQSIKAATARRVLTGHLNDAAQRRHAQTQQLVQRLNARWQSVESVKARVARVKFIQRWFRRLVANAKTATALQQVQPEVYQVVQCWTHMARAPFEKCMVLVQQRKVVQAAQRLVHVLTNEADHAPLAISNKGMNFRVLMMAGMIACHPDAIMEKERRSNRLLYAASVIVREMETLARCLATQQLQALSRCVARLAARFAFYTEAFARWKARDAQQLATELLTSYRELVQVCHKYQVQAQQVDEGCDGVHELLRQTQRQLLQLQQALTRVLGADVATEKIAALTVELDASVAMDTSATCVDSEHSIDTDEGEESEGRGTLMHGVDVNSSLLQDAHVVHHLILNPQYQLVRTQDLEQASASVPIDALALRVQKTMTKAFWDQMIQLNDIGTLVARTEEVRRSFRDAVSGGTGGPVRAGVAALVAKVDEALDRSHLEALMLDAHNQMHAIQARCVAVLDAVEQAEAPARVSSTRAFRVKWLQQIAAGGCTPIELLVAFLAFALDKMDELRLDALNAHLTVLATYLQQHGVAYEQKLLQTRVAEAGSVEKAFARTRKWLALEMEAYVVRQEVDGLEIERLARYEKTALERFVRTSIWALVEKHIEGTDARVWPETFELDVARLRACRDTLDRIAVVSSLVALVHEHVARCSLSAPTGFFHTLSQHLNTLLQSPGVSGTQVVAQAVYEVERLEKTSSDAVQGTELKTRLLGAFAADNAVFQLFFSRAAREFEAAVMSPSEPEAGVHPSLAAFQGEMTEAIAALRTLVQHNVRVYGALYNRLVQRLVDSAGRDDVRV